MKHCVSRLLVGLVFALPLALLTFALAQANSARQEAEPDCRSCHLVYQQRWQSGAHGNATADPDFVTAWKDQGQAQECLACHTTGYDQADGSYQAEGVTCAACHDPVPANHPLDPASMSRSSDLCGRCHRDTVFEWQNSRHGQSDLTCVSCHDPHATTILAEDASTLCAACHGTRVAAFAHSGHAQRGLTCTDCHMTDTGASPGMGNASKSHTSAVDPGTCNRCHESEIHSPSAAMLVAGNIPGPPAPPDSPTSGQSTTASTQPAPVGPAGFALVAGLIGLAFGLVLAPWLEHGFRRFRHPNQPREVEP